MINPNWENDFIKKRNEALFSLDRNKIEAYMCECGEEEIINQPNSVFWLAVYQAICQIPNAPSAVVEKSRRLSEDAQIEYLMTRGRTHCYKRGTVSLSISEDTADGTS